MSDATSDTASLILQIEAAGLNVDTTPLEAVLRSIAQTLNSHDIVVSKLPQVENAQSSLRKELNKLRLGLESVRADSANAANADEDDPVAPPRELDTDHSSTYGCRKDDIEPIHQKRAGDLSNAKGQATEKSLREIKFTLRRLQQDRDDGLANSMELDESITSLKETLFELQQKLASAASAEQMHALQQSLMSKFGSVEGRLQEFKAAFHEEVDGTVSKNLSEVKSWFKELETLSKQRQTKLEQRVSSCAREYDVASFRESVESSVATLANKSEFLDDTARAQGKTLVRLQQKSAVAMFHRHYTNWKQHALLKGLSRWKQVVQHQIQYEEAKASQKRLVRKTLTNIMSRRKRFGFERWVRHRDWHRKAERLKLKATTLIGERLGLYLSAPKTMAFNKWRRLTLMDKMKTHREADAAEEGTGDSSPSAPPTGQMPTTLCLTSILDSFKGDVHGATYALAAEIESIKSRDLVSLREDQKVMSQTLMSTLSTTVDAAIRNVDGAAKSFQETINKRVDSCTEELPLIQSKLMELAGQCKDGKAELERVEGSHKERIEDLFDQDRQLDRRLSAVEDLTKTAAHQITALSDEHTKSNTATQHLRELMARNEKRHEEERSRFQRALNHFGDELLKTKVTLGHTQVRCESLESELAETKSELVHFQEACQAEHDKVQRQVHHPGVPKPSLDRIVNVGHAYETLAKEKNYVTGINVAATLRSTAKSKMKRSGEKTRSEEEVDVPSEIVAFAHDYAAWVAYEADHESLLRLIAGTNPDEQVFAEDDNLDRRKELLAVLKSELGQLLEVASSYSTVAVGTDRNDPSSSTRGMGLRWEARAIFLARAKEAIEAALTKHDQVVLPATTRLGRSRPPSANVAVCVACDRPLRRKGPRTADGKPNEKHEKTADGTSGKGTKDSLPDVRPHTAAPSALGLQCGGGDSSSQIQRSSSMGQVIKNSRLAESLKENEANNCTGVDMAIG